MKLEDIDRVFEYANNINIAEMLNGSIPVPYTREQAFQWIKKHQCDSLESQAISWAIATKNDNALIGSIQLRVNREHETAYLSYWLGEPYWGKGYMNEAAQQIIIFALENLNVESVEAECFNRNLKSKNVLLKLGFIYCGNLSKTENLFQKVEIFDQYLLKKKSG